MYPARDGWHSLLSNPVFHIESKWCKHCWFHWPVSQRGVNKPTICFRYQKPSFGGIPKLLSTWSFRKKESPNMFVRFQGRGCAKSYYLYSSSSVISPGSGSHQDTWKISGIVLESCGTLNLKEYPNNVVAHRFFSVKCFCFSCKISLNSKSTFYCFPMELWGLEVKFHLFSNQFLIVGRC